LNLEALLILFFYCDEFNSTAEKELQSKHFSELAESRFVWSETTIKDFSLTFCQDRQQDWGISFDRFFMDYNPSSLSVSKIAIVKKVVLTLIEGMMENKDPKKAEALIQEYSTKRAR
jgi:hypothetical protein